MKLALFLVLFVAGLNLKAASTVDKVIGENDFIAVNDDATNIPFRYRKMVDAFGLLPMGCTGTHIGRGYVVTAGHCFWAPPEPVTNMPCEEITVAWGIRGDKAAYMTSQCEEIIVAQKSEKLDYAIIKVSPVPPVAIAPDLSRRVAFGDTLTIFSHPEDMPLQWSQLCGFEREAHPFLPPATVQHKCDTNPGSSGAAMINAVSLKIVAIHDGGVLDWDDSGNGMNYGTSVLNTEVYDQLKALGF